MGFGEALVLQLLARDGGRCLEVVLQAQRMPHLVHDGVLDDGLHEGFGLGAVRGQVAAGFQQVERKAHFGRGLGRVLAGGKAPRRPERRHRPGRALCRGTLLAAQPRVLHHEPPRAACEHVAHADVSVQDLARAGVGVRRADGKAHVGAEEPADRRMPAIHAVPGGIVGLLPHDDGVLEAQTFERLVPLQHAGLHGTAVAQRDVLVEPVDDGLPGLRQRRLWGPSFPGASGSRSARAGWP